MNNNSFESYEYKWKYNDTPTQPVPVSQKKKKSKWPGMVLTVLMVALLSVAGTVFVMQNIYPANMNGATLQTPVLMPAVTSGENRDGAQIPDITPGVELTNQQIIANGKKSVVGILSEIEVYSFGRTYTQQSVGSGFIVTADGYIITNAHVVENATRITVIMNDEKEYDATLVGEDALSDVAVVKISGSDFPAVELGNSDELVQGDPVIAIGTPAGIEFSGTATHGMISAINRDVKITDSYGNTTKTMTVIQIDAPINSGNSGGPLFDRFGRVIGITSLKLGNGFEGMGFALPINGVITIANELIENGEIIERPEGDFVTGKAFLGIEFYEVTEAQAKYYDIPSGVLVYQLTPGGAALKSGIKRGDIIIKFNGEKVEDSQDLSEAISDVKPGDRVVVRVDRSGEEMDIEVTMGYQS